MHPRRGNAARWPRKALIALTCAGLLTGLGGCYARAHTGAVVTAEYVPPRVETYPSYHYEGRIVYLVGDRWYYRDGPRWVYYAEEPTVLVRRRAYVRERGVVHRAPPAHERRHAPARRPHKERRRHRHH
jgi:hypothetical protein